MSTEKPTGGSPQASPDRSARGGATPDYRIAVIGDMPDGLIERVSAIHAQAILSSSLPAAGTSRKRGEEPDDESTEVRQTDVS